MAAASVEQASSGQRSRGSRAAPGGPFAFASTRALSRRAMIAAPVFWPRPSRLLEPLEVPAGKMADGLASLGLQTVGALLEHLPRDSREARTIATLAIGEQATVAVQVRSIRARPVRRRGMRPLVEASVYDATGTMRAMFFNQPWLVKRYPPGSELLLHGKAEARGGFRVTHHAPGRGSPAAAGAAPEAPERGSFEASGAAADGGEGEAARVAHYPATEGVSSTQILTLVRGARPALPDVSDALPARTRAAERLPDRASSLSAMHFPGSADDSEIARARLAFEELLLAQLLLLRRRARRRARADAPALDERPSLSERWLEHGLPFALTGDQRRAIAEIAADLQAPHAMQRLLMGEVGSGKTVVALYAMLRAVEHGRQAALMAPTETLAEQHFATVQSLIGAEPVSAALLTGSTRASRRREVVGRLASGELSLVVGTHALIEPDVRFRSLAVAIVDEQHRFGVRQRAALDEKGPPHTLHMTATPIPRTLALAGYGDLDTSALHELPRGRQPVRTGIVVGESARGRAYDELREELAKGRQAYVVCPLIDEDAPSRAHPSGRRQAGPGVDDGAHGAPSARAATAELERLRAGELAGYELSLLHGSMRPPAKQEAMARFASGRAHVLVSTTVIEVGIDVPNATVMLIENAERFGISQLHQLRGRVGRGEHGGRCLLMGASASSQRLRALAEHSDGFRLAEIDLELRKEGELVGTRQSGINQFKVAVMPEDASLLERARAHAQSIMAADPELEAPEHALLRDELERLYGREAIAPLRA